MQEKEDEYVYESLDSTSTLKNYIDCFAESNDIRFDGKSKRDRVKMALSSYAAFGEEVDPTLYEIAIDEPYL